APEGEPRVPAGPQPGGPHRHAPGSRRRRALPRVRDVRLGRGAPRGRRRPRRQVGVGAEVLMGSAIEMLAGVQVIDEARYARYRAEMTPRLEAYGGRFVLDVRVSGVLQAPLPSAFNRLFAIRFPSVQHRDAFLADADYATVRARWFEAAVSGGVVRLGDYA